MVQMFQAAWKSQDIQSWIHTCTLGSVKKSCSHLTFTAQIERIGSIYGISTKIRLYYFFLRLCVISSRGRSVDVPKGEHCQGSR